MGSQYEYAGVHQLTLFQISSKGSGVFTAYSFSESAFLIMAGCLINHIHIYIYVEFLKGFFNIGLFSS